MIDKFDKEYKWLSNFAPCKIILDGREYSSVEHAYMSAKSDNTDWKDICTDGSNAPGIIKKVSKMVELREDWEDIKIPIMEQCITQKFLQEPYKQLLLDTKNQLIQEGNWWGDKFWGICLKTNEGKNHLGKIIMQVRNDIRKGLWDLTPACKQCKEA